MNNIPADLKFNSSHEWIRLDSDNIATVGISDHAQGLLGDLVYVEAPEMDAELSAGEEAGVVESVKSASDVYTPVSGTIVEINTQLENAPELVNSNPYTNGWLFRIKLTNSAELDALMSATDYENSLEHTPEED